MANRLTEVDRYSAGARLRAPYAYALAIGLVGLCAFGRWMLGPILEGQGVYLAFMIPVAVSAFLGGTGPCTVAIVLSSIAASPIFRPPFEPDRAALAHLTMFVLESVAVLELFRRLQRHDAQLRAALESTEAARRSAEAANAAKEQFVARVSHEWRSPLNSIAGWVWQLERRADDAGLVRRAAASIGRSVETQSRLVSDLLDFTRGSSGKLSITPALLEVMDVIRPAIDSIAAGASSKRIAIEVSGNPSGTRVWGDAVRLEQVFVNLLHNAVKFTPANGRITVMLVRRGETVDVTVSDTGVGIKPDALATIFDAFAQSDERRDTEQGGLGLGLSIVRQIVQLHGGSVWATSEGAGRGSAFCVRLPMVGSQRRPAAAGAAEARHAKPEADRTTTAIKFRDAPTDTLETPDSHAC